MTPKRHSPYDAMPWLEKYDERVPRSMDAFTPAHICTLLDAAAESHPETAAVILFGEIPLFMPIPPRNQQELSVKFKVHPVKAYFAS